MDTFRTWSVAAIGTARRASQWSQASKDSVARSNDNHLTTWRTLVTLFYGARGWHRKPKMAQEHMQLGKESVDSAEQAWTAAPIRVDTNVADLTSQHACRCSLLNGGLAPLRSVMYSFQLSTGYQCP